MKTIDVLRAAREKVAQGWTQGATARDEEGFWVGVRTPAARSWSADGAVQFAARTLKMKKTVMLVLRAISGDDLVHWNDSVGRTQAQVLDLFDRAIAAEAGK